MFLIKPFSGILGVLVLLYIGWVFLAGQPSERIDRGCRPIGWAGNVLTSVFAIGAPSFSQATYRVFKNTEYTCQYAVWRLLYESEWVEHQRTTQTEGKKPDHAVGSQKLASTHEKVGTQHKQLKAEGEQK